LKAEKKEMLKKISSFSIAQNRTIFGMKNPLDEDIQVCSCEVLKVKCGPHLRGLNVNFYIVLYREMLKKSSPEKHYQMGQYLAWGIPNTRRFKFVQYKVPGVTNSPTLRGHSFV